MRIGIDARYYGVKNSGIGRYVKNLITELEALESQDEFYILLNEEGFNLYQPTNPHFHKVLFPHHPYSLNSQLVDWWRLLSLKLDLVHFVNFSFPILYSGQFIVTIHDLTMVEQDNAVATTRNRLVYGIKNWAAKEIFAQALKKSLAIITPSQFVRQKLIAKYQASTKKVHAIYEGVENTLKVNDKESPKILSEHGLRAGEYLLYVGSVYPHKNVEQLLSVIEKIQARNF